MGYTRITPKQRRSATQKVFKIGYAYGLKHEHPVHTRLYIEDLYEAAWIAGYNLARMVVLSETTSTNPIIARSIATCGPIANRPAF